MLNLTNNLEFCTCDETEKTAADLVWFKAEGTGLYNLSTGGYSVKMATFHL